jgi:hypothetical protein
MQEDQTVTFQPMYVDSAQPWFTNLFILYLLIVFVVLIARAVQIAITMRKLRKVRASGSTSPSNTDELFFYIAQKAQSLRRFATLTFLLALLDLTWSTSDILLGLRTMKSTNYSFVAARMGAALVPFAMGLIACIALNVTAMVSDSAVRRRQLTCQSLLNQTEN